MFAALALVLMPATTVVPPPPARPAEARRICRKEVDTGSRLGGKRRCLTAAEWEAEARAQGDQFNNQQRYQSRAGN